MGQPSAGLHNHFRAKKRQEQTIDEVTGLGNRVNPVRLEQPQEELGEG